MTEFPFQTLGRYTIRGELGRGGFATVYRALDTSLEREVALKILHPQLLTDRSFAERFRREARALAALRHPHIVTIYEVGEADGRLYIAMELAKGPSLAQAIAEHGRMSWTETLALLKPVCEALDYAHTQGVVHRDLKPSNILLDKERGTLLTDFGFARLVGESSVSMSLSGGILGTPAYIAPEVWELEAAKPTADIYALGCILYEMLTGEVLFAGKTPMQAMRAHDRGPQLPPASAWPAGVPSGVEAVLRQALARQPEARFPSASAVWLALNDLEAEAKAGRERAERAAVAAQWKAEAEAALAGGEWSAARMAVGRWLAITPDDKAAQVMRQEIDRREFEARAQAEAEVRQRQEAEHKAAEEVARRAREEHELRVREQAQSTAEQRAREEQARRVQAGLDQIEAAAQARREAERQAREEQARKKREEQAEREREAERLRQYRLAQEAEEQKARKAAQLAEEERRRRETAARPTQETPRAAVQPVGCAFGFWWTAATVFGIAVGLGVGVGLNLIVSTNRALPFLIWTVAGIVVGAAQFLALRRQMSGAGWWILASGADWMVGLVIGGLLIPTGHYDSHYAMWSQLGVSLSVGFVQWFLLRRQVSRAGLWIPVNVIGWLVAWGVVWIMAWPVVKDNEILTLITPPILAGIVGGSITGLALLLLLNSNRSKQEEQRAAQRTATAPPSTSKLRLPAWAWVAIVVSVLACLFCSLLLLSYLGLAQF